MEVGGVRREQHGKSFKKLRGLFRCDWADLDPAINSFA